MYQLYTHYYQKNTYQRQKLSKLIFIAFSFISRTIVDSGVLKFVYVLKICDIICLTRAFLSLLWSSYADFVIIHNPCIFSLLLMWMSPIVSHLIWKPFTYAIHGAVLMNTLRVSLLSAWSGYEKRTNRPSEW